MFGVIGSSQIMPTFHRIIEYFLLWLLSVQLLFYLHFFSFWHLSHSCLVIRKFCFLMVIELTWCTFHLSCVYMFLLSFSQCGVSASDFLFELLIVWFLEAEMMESLSVPSVSLRLLSVLGFKSTLIFLRLHTKNWNISTNLILSKLIILLLFMHD